MPYGKRTTIRNTRAKSYVARGRDARQNKFAKARTAVAKIQRKPYVPRIVKYTQSVYQLANAVKKLQLAKLGEFQKRAEKFSWIKSVDSAGTPFLADKPLCFNLNGFTDRDYDTGAQLRFRAPSIPRPLGNGIATGCRHFGARVCRCAC
jgi:hypothetical protein